MNFDPGNADSMSRDDLVNFLSSLADSLGQDPQSWDNISLEDFLRAWAAWLTDIEGYFSGRGEPTPTAPTWALIASMLLAARIYE